MEKNVEVYRFECIVWYSGKEQHSMEVADEIAAIFENRGVKLIRMGYGTLPVPIEDSKSEMEGMVEDE